MNCISAWDMRFKGSSKGQGTRDELKNNSKFKTQNSKLNLPLITRCLLLVACYSLLVTAVYAELIERVVAVVDDDIILLSEFRENLQAAVSGKKSAKEEEVLQGMINRLLLLKEAKRFRIEPLSEKENENILVNEYIEKRLRPFIRIPDEEIALFYRQHITSFGNKEILDVRDEIESYLAEKELNKKLLEHIEELRRKAYIRIQRQ
ncbi:MAG: hypothetical protein HY756_09455 [Nitrospirae bacterium]|nr:hypothetical protein [Nitrospirota bacterium]